MKILSLELEYVLGKVLGIQARPTNGGPKKYLKRKSNPNHTKTI